MRHVGFYAGLFLVAAATLMLQLVQTRILSVVSWYHLAFFAISIAMFGLTAGSVWVYLRRERFTEATLSHDLTYFSSALALTTVLGFAAQLTLAPLAKPSLISVLIWAELAICLAIPFFFSGVVVSLALTRSPFPIGRVYGADLAGAALGSIGVLALLNTVDGPSAVLWIAAIAALAAVLFSTSTIGTAPPGRPPLAGLLRRPAALLPVLILVAIANNFASPRGLHPVFVKGRIEAMDIRIFEEWNSFSRIIVFDTSNPRPHMWGPSPRFEPEAWPIRQRGLNIDGSAGTTTFNVDGSIEHAGFLRYDVTNLAYHLPDRQNAAVIGVGGGRDILSARLFGVPEITGVEINPVLHRLLTREPGFAEFAGLNSMRRHRDRGRRGQELVGAQRRDLRHHPDDASSTPGPRPGRAPSRSARTASTRCRRGDLSRPAEAWRRLHRESLVRSEPGRGDRPDGQPRHGGGDGERRTAIRAGTSSLRARSGLQRSFSRAIRYRQRRSRRSSAPRRTSTTRS